MPRANGPGSGGSTVSLGAGSSSTVTTVLCANAFAQSTALAATAASDLICGVIASSPTKRLETCAEFRGECRRLFPRRKMRALGEAVVVDELGIRLLSPPLRRLVDLFAESAHGDRDLDAPHIEEAAWRKIMSVIPVEACGGDRGVRQPVERDVIEDIV